MTGTRGFVHLKEAFYADVILADMAKMRPPERDKISIEGKHGGEFSIHWIDLGESQGPAPHLEVFGDGAALLEGCPELIAWMAEQDRVRNRNWRPDELIEKLTEWGFEDLTKREDPMSKSRSKAVPGRYASGDFKRMDCPHCGKPLRFDRDATGAMTADCCGWHWFTGEPAYDLTCSRAGGADQLAGEDD